MDAVDLVSRFISGDETAFDEIYQKYVKLVRYIAYQLSKDQADTDDIVQEVFIQVYRSLCDLKDPRQLKAWISRITYSKAKMKFRSKRDKNMDDAMVDILYKKEEIHKDYLPYEHTKHKVNFDALCTCIACLKGEYREVIALFYFGQFSIKEIAELTGKPEGTIKSRISYAKKNLKKIIKDYETINDTHITFHGIPIGFVLLSLGCKATNDHLRLKQFSAVAIAPVTVGITACVVAICVGGLLYQNKQLQPPLQNNSNTSSYKQTERKFKPVQYQNRWINTPREAYTTLLEWAHCEVELREKNEADFQNIQPVYEALADYGEGYFDLLDTIEWKEAYSTYLSQK